MYFDASQIAIARQAFLHAENMVTQHYRLSNADCKNLRYDVKTLAHLEKHEVSETAFAQLCRYGYQTDMRADIMGAWYFYRICLQDNRIMGAVNRIGSFIKLPPLLLYIATHELVHVIRFNAGEGIFDVTAEEKELEEQKVHSITSQMLSSIIYPDMKVVLDCFSDRPTIGDLIN